MTSVTGCTLVRSSRRGPGDLASIAAGKAMARAAIVPVILAATAFMASPAAATLVNVDFNSNGPGTLVGTFSGTGVLGGGTWNGVTVDRTAQTLASTALLDSSGTASGISVAIPAFQGAWNLATQSASAWKPLLGDYVYVTQAGQSTATISLSGLGSSTAWDLVFYAANGQGEGSDFTIGGITKRTTDSGGIGATLTAGDEYVAFTNVFSDSLGTISITWSNYAETPGSVLNGFQIQSVPEPSGLALLVVAVVAGAAGRTAKSAARRP